VGEWVIAAARGIKAFYDIDTPITLSRIECGNAEYISADLIPLFNMYLSFTGGPMLKRLEQQYKSPMARSLYCSVDPDFYFPCECAKKWDIGYLGTYSEDRQPFLDRLMLEPARRWSDGNFTVAGPLYPDSIAWPDNVERIEYLPHSEHRTFYSSMKFTLNITRADMVRAGYSPSVRLFEAAACSTPIISDYWDGLETFFNPGTEILVSYSAEDTLRYLYETTEEERRAIGERARARILAGHTAAHRALELEGYVNELFKKMRRQQEEVNYGVNTNRNNAA
jgi:spore maturation protein CgeB